MRRLGLLLFTTCHFAVMAQQPVEYKKEVRGELMLVMVKNQLPAAITIRMRSDSLKLDKTVLIEHSAEFKEIYQFKANGLTENDTLSKFITFNTKIGNPDAEHDHNYLYSLPFAQGKSYYLMQGFGGKFSHSSTLSKYALDFKMNVGQPVHAAREGVVTWVDEGFDEGGRDREKYINKANRIMIVHNDGTIGYYLHLKKDGALVEVGDKVEKGQLIGLSGNTGFSTSPHLHFVVRAGDVAVPIRFENQRSKLRAGKYYSLKN